MKDVVFSNEILEELIERIELKNVDIVHGATLWVDTETLMSKPSSWAEDDKFRAIPSSQILLSQKQRQSLFISGRPKPRPVPVPVSDLQRWARG